MFKMRQHSTSSLVLTCLLSSAGIVAAQDVVRAPAQTTPQTYQVTVTSLIHGTPPSLFPTNAANTIFAGTSCVDTNNVPRVGEMLGLWVVATSDSSFSLFTEGQPPLPDLARLSQTGRPFYLANTLASNSHVGNAFTIPANPNGTLPNPIPFPPATGVGDIVLCPGQALTFTVTSQGSFQYLSLAAMVFPTNDGFTGITGVPLPTGSAPLTVYAPAYDSGSEENDELCGNIPSLIVASFPFPATTIGGATLAKGAACPNGGGAQDFNSDPLSAVSPDNLPRAEGVVHIHPGIRGVGDLAPSVWGWENPVMKVVIQKM